MNSTQAPPVLSIYTTFVFPRLMDWALRGGHFDEERSTLLRKVHGSILEIGFGTGLNLPHYPVTVSNLHAIDPVPLLPARVAARIAQAPFPVHLTYANAEVLPFATARFDWAVSTFTLCTVPDPIAELLEIKRVLKPGGRYLFLENGRRERPSVARWQDRLNPVQNVVGCGCNLNRAIDRLVMDAGLVIEQLERRLLPGTPRLVGSLYCGAARRVDR